MTAKKPEVSAIEYFTLNFPCDWDVFGKNWKWTPHRPPIPDLGYHEAFSARQMRLLLEAFNACLKSPSTKDEPANAAALRWGDLRPALASKIESDSDRHAIALVLTRMNPETFGTIDAVKVKLATELEQLRARL